MNNLLRVLLIAGLAACGTVILALGFVGHDVELMAPVHLAVFLLALLAYLLPTGLALYRDCKATLRIGLLNVFLGWTVIGWAAALAWAARGRVREPSRPTGPAPTHPMPPAVKA